MRELWQKNRPLFLILIGLTVAVSVLATLGALYLLSDTTFGKSLRDRLGLANLQGFNIETTRVDRVVVEESSAIVDATKKIGTSVVSITSSGAARREIPGFGTIEAPQTSGTGFIVTSDGLIATNKHVVRGSQTFTVTTAEGKTFDGKVVATDPTNDLALIKIEERGLPVADLGDSDRVQVGQWVIAIGNALGELQNTVTVGVISAKERSAQPSDSSGQSESLDGLLQTDAAINPGNSGGPLVNLSGQVIGINTAIAGNAQNIGFAIPVNDLKKDLDSYSKTGKILQPYMGVRYQTITKAVAKASNLPVQEGALLISLGRLPAVTPDSPAAAAGLKEDDIITKINNDKITESLPLARLIRRYNPNDQVTLTVLRNGSELRLELTLGELGR